MLACEQRLMRSNVSVQWVVVGGKPMSALARKYLRPSGLLKYFQTYANQCRLGIAKGEIDQIYVVNVARTD